MLRENRFCTGAAGDRKVGLATGAEEKAATATSGTMPITAAKAILFTERRPNRIFVAFTFELKLPLQNLRNL
ncbi:MAG: hypothetical protein KDA42_08975 [Planctomycetales bacterium]|nr:hypothetical protein [Planctomycetales bacterium]